jgi:hypothetical protein
MARRLIYTREARAVLEAVSGWLTQPGSGRAARRKLGAISARLPLIEPPRAAAAQLHREVA